MNVVDSQDAVRGKYVVASRDIAKGSLIASAELLCASAEAQYLQDFCGYCLKLSDDPSTYFRVKCKACGTRYCSERCKGLHSGPHPCAITRLVLRKRKSRIRVDPCLLLDVIALAPHLDSLQLALGSDVHEAVDVDAMMESLKVVDVTHLSRCVVVEAIRAIYCNAFALDAPPLEGEGTDVVTYGIAMFPDASRFNHSCEPNASRTRIGRRLHILAARDIAKGEEITITYTSLKKSRADRRTHLQQYGFTCVCPRCENDSAVDEAQLCNSCGSQMATEQLCSVCDVSRLRQIFEESH